MESFIDRITEETDENFRICRENIPNFETSTFTFLHNFSHSSLSLLSAISPLLNTMKNIKLLLDDAAFDQQKLENNCEETCMNCTKSQLNDFLGIKVEASTIVDVKSQLVPQSKESSALVETNEPNEQGLSSKPKENDIRIVPQITDEEFKTIPKYQLGRLTLEMMNEIVSKMDDFLMKKSKILGKTNKQLTRSDREVLDNWRELVSLFYLFY